MRVVTDTNILVSALLAGQSNPARIVALWRDGRFDLMTSATQLDELARVTRYPKIRSRLTLGLAGRLVNDLRALAISIVDIPAVDRATDPDDNVLLGMAEAGRAEYLVSGDKRHLLGLRSHEGAKIVTARDFLTVMDKQR